MKAPLVNKLARIALPITILFAVSSLHAEVYRWVDEKGKIHFSDSPKENANADTVEINQANSFAGKETLKTINQANDKSSTTNLPQRHSAPTRFSYSAPGQSQNHQNELERRIQDCKKNRQVDCSTTRIRSEMSGEQYWTSPAGRAEQQGIARERAQQRRN